MGQGLLIRGSETYFKLKYLLPELFETHVGILVNYTFCQLKDDDKIESPSEKRKHACFFSKTAL